MPEIPQKDLDALKKAITDAKIALSQKTDKATITRELVAGLLTTELRPVLLKLNENIAALKDIKIVTPPIEVQDVKATIKVDVPPVKVPDIKIPEIKIPEIKVPPIKMPKMKAAPVNVNIPDIIVPEIKVPPINVKVPAIQTDKLIRAIEEAIKGITIRPPSVSVSGGRGGAKPATQPTSINVAMATSGTEYSAILPPGTKNFTAKLRSTSANLLISYSAGGTSDNFITLTRGQTYTSPEGMDLTNIKIYLQANANTQVAEIVCWT